MSNGYLAELGGHLDAGWRKFWFTPCDPFGLGVMRVVAGAMACYFIASYSFDLVDWFGPNGLLTRELASGLATGFGTQSVYRFSLFQLSTDPAWLWSVHVLSLLAAVALTCGVVSRLAAPLTLLAVLSYVHRAPMINGQFEPVLTFLLAYLCLGPCGACLSWDARRRAAAAVPASWTANVGLRLMQVHLAALHLMIGLTMLAGESWWVGDAFWWLAAHAESRLVDLTWLLNSSGGLYLVNLISHGIVAFHLLYGTLVWHRLARPLLIVAALVVWLLVGLVTGLVSYCLLMAASNLVFVPSANLRRLLTRTSSET